MILVIFAFTRSLQMKENIYAYQQPQNQATYPGLYNPFESVNSMTYNHLVEGRKKKERKIRFKSWFVYWRCSPSLSIYEQSNVSISSALSDSLYTKRRVILSITKGILSV